MSSSKFLLAYINQMYQGIPSLLHWCNVCDYDKINACHAFKLCNGGVTHESAINEIKSDCRLGITRVINLLSKYQIYIDKIKPVNIEISNPALPFLYCKPAFLFKTKANKTGAVLFVYVSDEDAMKSYINGGLYDEYAYTAKLICDVDKICLIGLKVEDIFRGYEYHCHKLFQTIEDEKKLVKDLIEGYTNYIIKFMQDHYSIYVITNMEGTIKGMMNKIFKQKKREKGCFDKWFNMSNDELVTVNEIKRECRLEIFNKCLNEFEENKKKTKEINN